jgi:hypothetical protein
MSNHAHYSPFDTTSQGPFFFFFFFFLLLCKWKFSFGNVSCSVIFFSFCQQNNICAYTGDDDVAAAPSAAQNPTPILLLPVVSNFKLPALHTLHRTSIHLSFSLRTQ